MRFFIFGFLFFLSFPGVAQQIQYLNKYRQPVNDSASTVFFTKTFKNPNSEEALVRTYYLDGV